VSALGQRTLLQHLLSADSLEILSSEGLPPECVPTEQMRPIVNWAIDYYYRSGCQRAPSEEALRAVEINGTTFGDILDDHEIPFGDDPEDTIEWAIEDLRGTYVYKQANQFNKNFATEMAKAELRDRVGVVNEFASGLVGLASSMESRYFHADMRTDISNRILDYEGRAAHIGTHRGMAFGLPDIDLHTYGIHDGELCTLAAPPKTGKSYFAAWVAYQEWLAGRVVAMFTLENSVQMTLDRIACLACRVNPTSWQRGTCTPDQVEKVRAWEVEVAKSSTPLYVLQPDMGRRTVDHMVRDAVLREADSLIIDQLTFVEHDQAIRQKDQQIAKSLHRLKGLISTGSRRMPCLLIHQINREGQKAAEKAGHLEMYHLAEAADVERTSDWVLGMFATADDFAISEVKMQTLASRRAAVRHWRMAWDIPKSDIRVLGTIDHL
jgi:DnaB helicase-like protein